MFRAAAVCRYPLLLMPTSFHAAAAARLLLETMRISMLGTNRGPLEELLAEAASSYTASQACRTVVHSVTQVCGPVQG